MNATALLLAVALFGTLPARPARAPQESPSTSPTPEQRLAALPPRAKIAGLAGLQSRSLVTFADPAARRHSLEATFVFPERARWTLAPLDGRPGERHIVYRCGSAFFELAAQASAARLISDRGAEDPQWRASLASVELRRALFLWPDGFEWQGEATRRTVALAGGERIEAELGPDGRPIALALQGDRARRESYRSVTWREQRGRLVPAAFELAIDGELVWREEVTELETAVRVLDTYFLPPELRPGAPAAGERRVVHVDVPLGHVLRVPLAEGTEWSAVADRWRAALAPYSRPEQGGWRLEGGACVEVGAGGEPRAILLRFKPGLGAAPAGVEPVREHGALAASLSPRPEAPAALEVELAALRSAVPAGAAPGTAFARFSGPPALDSGPVQLFLPLVAAK